MTEVGDYIQLERLGKGAFGQVFKAKRKNTQEFVALKYLDRLEAMKSQLAGIQKETDIMRGLNHPHVIKLLDDFKTSTSIVMVLEIASTDLGNLINTGGTKNKEHGISCDLVSALFYLHSHCVLHRDLKPANILIVNDVVKLCDFGLAVKMEKNSFCNKFMKLGTPAYMAPEMLGPPSSDKVDPYNEKVDIWAMGCIIYEMHFKRRPAPVSFPRDLPAETKDLLEKLLTVSPRDRIPWAELLVHPWFKGELKVSSEDKLLESPLTRPDIALRNRKRYNREVYYRGRGLPVPPENDMDMTDGAEPWEVEGEWLYDVLEESDYEDD